MAWKRRPGWGNTATVELVNSDEDNAAREYMAEEAESKVAEQRRGKEEARDMIARKSREVAAGERHLERREPGTEHREQVGDLQRRIQARRYVARTDFLAEQNRLMEIEPRAANDRQLAHEAGNVLDATHEDDEAPRHAMKCGRSSGRFKTPPPPSSQPLARPGAIDAGVLV